MESLYVLRTIGFTSSQAMQLLGILNCPCMNDVNEEDIIAAAHHLVSILSMRPTCVFVKATITFQISEHRYPSQEELQQTSVAMLRFQIDPELYFEEEKVIIATENIEHLSITKQTEAQTVCTICLEDVTPGQKVIVLPACKHTFHAEEEDCLGKGNCIVTWMQQSCFCPNCKVRIEPKKPEETKQEYDWTKSANSYCEGPASRTRFRTSLTRRPNVE